MTYLTISFMPYRIIYTYIIYIYIYIIFTLVIGGVLKRENP